MVANCSSDYYSTESPQPRHQTSSINTLVLYHFWTFADLKEMKFLPLDIGFLRRWTCLSTETWWTAPAAANMESKMFGATWGENSIWNQGITDNRWRDTAAAGLWFRREGRSPVPSRSRERDVAGKLFSLRPCPADRRVFPCKDALWRASLLIPDRECDYVRKQCLLNINQSLQNWKKENLWSLYSSNKHKVKIWTWDGKCTTSLATLLRILFFSFLSPVMNKLSFSMWKHGLRN